MKQSSAVANQRCWHSRSPLNLSQSHFCSVVWPSLAELCKSWTH